jgi:hypothetical protein
MSGVFHHHWKYSLDSKSWRHTTGHTVEKCPSNGSEGEQSTLGDDCACNFSHILTSPWLFVSYIRIRGLASTMTRISITPSFIWVVINQINNSCIIGMTIVTIKGKALGLQTEDHPATWPRRPLPFFWNIPCMELDSLDVTE